LAHRYYIIILVGLLWNGDIWAQNNINYFPLNKEGDQYNLNEKMSINMKESDIKNVLMLIGELTGLNIVISPAVKDTITANLENVSVKAALDAILKPNGYSYFVQENIIIVKSNDMDMVGELETMVIKLKYINSDDLQGPMGAVMSGRGTVTSFTPLVTSSSVKGASNIIVLSDVQENIPSILKMIEQLDKPIPNINIAVRFIETNLDTTRGHGIDWTRAPIQLGGTSDSSSSIMPINFSNITIATLSPLQLSSALKVMQARGQSKLLSSPQVTTLDNHEAETETVTTVYIEGGGSSSGNSQYQQGNQAGQSSNSNQFGNMFSNSVSEKDIGIKLKVTPRINEASRITLLVDATVEALLSAAEINTDKPRSTKRTVKTQVTVSDGDTVIIGGLIAENALENKKFVPILSSIPFIGKLFQSTSIEKEQRELLIFITPNVIG
jgi:type IV pilus assembly protein PilQ|tara:strand:+ start:641 stop:1960 length:1320 start_codon:yes stop_codon:yes gene_type:complete